MAIILNTAEIDFDSLSGMHTYWVYNGFDCCITSEVFAANSEEVTPEAATVYSFERAMQAPALDMMNRGVLVDLNWRNKRRTELEALLAKLQHIINLYSQAISGENLNPGSTQQKATLLYDIMRLPEQTKKDKKSGKISRTTDREALEKLSLNFYAKPLIKALLSYADVSKKLGVLRYGIDSDNRFRAAYSVAATETGRWSSRGNAFGTGANWQNITEELRRMFVADKGMKVAYIDLEQAESRAVGLIVWLLFGESAYLDACMSGDLHTLVCQMCWTKLPWPEEFNLDAVRKYGTLPKDLISAAKKVAKQKAYRELSYRDLSKRLGHGSNYGGQAFTMARHTKVEEAAVAAFQEAYFGAFPGIRKWHYNVAQQIQTKGTITTALGRRRIFFGRSSDSSTLREAIAFEPQSFATGDYLNLGLYRVWKNLCRDYPIQLIGQIHDAIAFQYPESLEDQIIPKVSETLKVNLTFSRPDGSSRNFFIPSEPKTGWNFSKYNNDPAEGELNLDGLKDWSGNDQRQRTSFPPESMLDLIVY
jgi:DNA polymerase I-like protein with 3'-5' exonuclease and polymerase domains